MGSRSEHWNSLYQKGSATEASWFQSEARVSLELIEACSRSPAAAVIDVAAGASTLADGLVARGCTDITLLDIAEGAFAETRRRLPDAKLCYEVSDITTWKPSRMYDIWHDRAVFHFLGEEGERAAYKQALAAAIPVGRHAIVGTFAQDGPERCSGLPVRRYTAASLAEEFRGLLEAQEARAERHVTPSGAEQSFIFVRFSRV